MEQLKLTQKQIEEHNQKEILNYQKNLDEFKKNYSLNICSLCNKKLDFFDEEVFCLHWFLIPNGIRKKHFKKHLNKPLSYFNLETQLKWFATIENPIKSINDLSIDKKTKLKEITIIYKNIEWSINYGITDLEGHKNSLNGNFPHYHIQIMIDNKPFIKFNDFHIPFTKYDLYLLKLIENNKEEIDVYDDYGKGASQLVDPEFLELLLENVTVSKDKNKSLINTRTIVTRPNGQLISQEIMDIIKKESELTKVPKRKLIKKYYPDAEIITEVEIGNGVIGKKIRTPRNSK